MKHSHGKSFNTKVMPHSEWTSDRDTREKKKFSCTSALIQIYRSFQQKRSISLSFIINILYSQEKCQSHKNLSRLTNMRKAVSHTKKFLKLSSRPNPIIPWHAQPLKTQPCSLPVQACHRYLCRSPFAHKCLPLSYATFRPLLFHPT